MTVLGNLTCGVSKCRLHPFVKTYTESHPTAAPARNVKCSLLVSKNREASSSLMPTLRRDARLIASTCPTGFVKNDWLNTKPPQNRRHKMNDMATDLITP